MVTCHFCFDQPRSTNVVHHPVMNHFPVSQAILAQAIFIQVCCVLPCFVWTRFVLVHALAAVGFHFDFATQEGNEMALEEWTFDLAVGYEDVIRATRDSVSDRLATPQKFDNVTNLDAYAAVFIPGGHGPVIDVHLHESLGRILRVAHAQELTTISLCHGPNALRSAALGGDFPYSGYKIRIFPDSADDWSPTVGYLPGYITEAMKAEANLKALGVEVENTEMDDSLRVDRELVTGASQLAAQNLAVAALEVLQTKFDFEATSSVADTTSPVASRVRSLCFGPVLLTVFLKRPFPLSCNHTCCRELLCMAGHVHTV